MTDKERIKNLQKAMGVIRKGVLDFQESARKEEEREKEEVMGQVLQMVDRVISIYA